LIDARGEIKAATKSGWLSQRTRPTYRNSVDYLANCQRHASIYAYHQTGQISHTDGFASVQKNIFTGCVRQNESETSKCSPTSLYLCLISVSNKDRMCQKSIQMPQICFTERNDRLGYTVDWLLLCTVGKCSETSIIISHRIDSWDNENENKRRERERQREIILKYVVKIYVKIYVYKIKTSKQRCVSCYIL